DFGRPPAPRHRHPARLGRDPRQGAGAVRRRGHGAGAAGRWAGPRPGMAAGVRRPRSDAAHHQQSVRADHGGQRRAHPGRRRLGFRRRLGRRCGGRMGAGVPPAAALRAGSAETRLRRRTGAFGAAALVLAAAAALLARIPAVENQPWPGFASALAAVLAWAAATPLLLGLALPALRRRFLARGLGAPGLAAASLAGALRRSAVLTVAVATAIGVMLGVAIMVGSFRETVSQWLGEQLQNDVFVRAADWDRSHPVPLPAAVLAAAAATPGAAAVAASCTQLWSFHGQPIVLNTRWPLTGSAAMPRYRFLAGGAGPVIVSEPFARRFHLGPGSRLELDAPQGPLHLAISGVFYDYTTDRGIVTLDRATFERGFGAPRATEIGLDAAQGVSAAQLQRNFAERAGGGGGPVRGLAINENA